MSSGIQIASDETRSDIQAASVGFCHDTAPLAQLLVEQGVTQRGIEGLFQVLDQLELEDPCVGLEVEFLGTGFSEVPTECESFAGPIDWSLHGNIMVGVSQLEVFNKTKIFVAVADFCGWCAAASVCQQRRELQLA